MVPDCPRFALVQWPDGIQELPSCITLDAVPDALSRDAVVIAREDAELTMPAPVTILSNPRRHTDDEDGA